MQLESSIIYGPIHSRRFGWDLGVNLLPVTQKVCCYDCIYCQYGFTPAPRGKSFVFPSASDILVAWSREINTAARKGIRIEHATISGNGEPTMHPDFPNIMRTLVDWRNRHFEAMKIALLSTGYRAGEPEIRAAMQLADESVLKLDAGSEKIWRRINRPRFRTTFHQMKSCFKNFPGLIIQSMFVKNWNDGPADIEWWTSALHEIRPSSVQIYTIARKPALASLAPVERDFLLHLAVRTSTALNIPVIAY